MRVCVDLRCKQQHDPEVGKVPLAEAIAESGSAVHTPRMVHQEIQSSHVGEATMATGTCNRELGDIAMLRKALHTLAEDFKWGRIDRVVMAMVREKIVGALEQLGEDVE